MDILVALITLTVFLFVALCIAVSFFLYDEFAIDNHYLDCDHPKWQCHLIFIFMFARHTLFFVVKHLTGYLRDSFRR